MGGPPTRTKGDQVGHLEKPAKKGGNLRKTTQDRPKGTQDGTPRKASQKGGNLRKTFQDRPFGRWACEAS